MNNKHLSKLCSIDCSLKGGRTRLTLSERDYFDYLLDCVAENEEEIETQKFTDKQLKYSY